MKLDSRSTCNIKKNEPLADVVRQCGYKCWDEGPNQNKYLLEAMDRTDRDIREQNTPFGGIPMIIAGDFRQVSVEFHKAKC